VPSLDEIPFPAKPLWIQGTERSGAHNSHNHPSGIAEPSRADQILTRELQNALKLVDVQVLDHIIVAAGASVSFAERGLI
jgi:DNA repair protein RadC